MSFCFAVSIKKYLIVELYKYEEQLAIISKPFSFFYEKMDIIRAYSYLLKLKYMIL